MISDTFFVIGALLTIIIFLLASLLNLSAILRGEAIEVKAPLLLCPFPILVFIASATAKYIGMP